MKFSSCLSKTGGFCRFTTRTPSFLSEAKIGPAIAEWIFGSDPLLSSVEIRILYSSTG